MNNGPLKMSIKHHSVASFIVKLHVEGPLLTLTMKMDQLPTNTFLQCQIC